MSDALRVRVAAACMEMERTLQSRMYSRFLELEVEFYEKIVKAGESKTHYEYCFNEFDPIGAKYGDVLLNAGKKFQSNIEKSSYESAPEPRVLYLLPNLDNDLAHIEHLYSVLKHHPEGSRLKITVSGYRRSSGPLKSRYIAKLAEERRITISVFENSHSGRLNLLNYFLSNHYDQLVIYSVPLQLSAWCRALGSKSVTWISTKFKLDCFPELINRVAGETTNPSGELPNNRKWRLYSPSMDKADQFPDFNRIGRTRTRLITINREEKINSPEFLHSVRQILLSRLRTTFAWTGRCELETIKGFFSEAGLSERVNYLGWVEPVDVIGDYDIFLDTPGLSGIVAAKACFSGMPTVSFKGAGAWIENRELEFINGLGAVAEANRNPVALASSNEEFIETCLALIDSDELYIRRGLAQKDIGKRYFTNSEQMYRNHTNHILDFINSRSHSSYDVRSSS